MCGDQRPRLAWEENCIRETCIGARNGKEAINNNSGFGNEMCGSSRDWAEQKGEAEGSREKSHIEVAILDTKNFT